MLQSSAVPQDHSTFWQLVVTSGYMITFIENMFCLQKTKKKLTLIIKTAKNEVELKLIQLISRFLCLIHPLVA